MNGLGAALKERTTTPARITQEPGRRKKKDRPQRRVTRRDTTTTTTTTTTAQLGGRNSFHEGYANLPR